MHLKFKLLRKCPVCYDFLYYDKPTKTNNLFFVTKWSFTSRTMRFLFGEIQILIWPKPRFVWDKDSEFVWHDLKHSELSIKVWVLKVRYHCTTWKFQVGTSISLKNIRYEPYLLNQTIKIWVSKNGSEYFLLISTRDLRTTQICSLLNLVVWRSEDTWGSKMNG